jgi:hypothetical protein
LYSTTSTRARVCKAQDAKSLRPTTGRSVVFEDIGNILRRTEGTEVEGRGQMKIDID